jgi:hypothetical protein
MGREKDVISVGTHNFKSRVNKGPIKEENIFVFPYSQKWVRWKFRDLNNYLLKNVMLKIAEKKVDKLISGYDYDIMHIVNHGHLSAYPCRNEYINGKKLWVSFHDYYSESSCYDDTKKLWQQADRRMVISNELGTKYAEEFGNGDFEIITDGLLENEISVPRNKNKDFITIYFGGLLHYYYMPLFSVLGTALNSIVKNKNIKIRLVVRGVHQTDLFKNNLFSVEYRNDFVSDAEIQKELNEADILYLPIKFNKPGFYLYSLSTKMVGYLGAPGKILYHGPADSAACKLLDKAQAAICCTSLKVSDLINAVQALIEDTTEVSSNAKQLACNNFRLESIQQKFWNN